MDSSIPASTSTATTGRAAMAPALTAAQRAATLEKFFQQRRAWERNPALRSLYAAWYGRISQFLDGAPSGPRVELGSGPGFARQFIPDIILTDLVAAPWHDREVGADRLPFSSGQLAALVLFDVLHHLSSPAAFFDEAMRTLTAGGLVIICDPYISPLSYPIYKFLHEEPVDLWADVLNQREDPTQGRAKDPFHSNQAIATLLFGRQRARFERRFPGLELMRYETLAGPSYAATGGYSRPPLLPFPLWQRLESIERRLPKAILRWLAFRLLVVLRKRP